VLTLWYGVVGAAVGSFLNVCIDRWSSGGSIASPPSHCPTCGHRLMGRDLIPILSYVWLGGRCRYCADSIPLRLPAVELGTGLVFALLWQRYEAVIALLLASLYCCVLIVVSVIDLEQQVIPNRVIRPSIVFALAGALISPSLSLRESLIGGLVGFGFLFAVAFISPAGMGMGDVRLAAFIGLAVGFPAIVLALVVGIVGGGVVAALLLVTRVKGRRDPIPFGPFLALGAVVALLYGPQILSWYTGL